MVDRMPEGYDLNEVIRKWVLRIYVIATLPIVIHWWGMVNGVWESYR